MNKSGKSALRYKAYETIKSKILNLEIKPGDKIHENDFAKSLNISRTPVREALLLLQQEGLVICSNNLGFLVNRYTRKDADEYFKVREVIEELVISLVVERITDQEQSYLKNCLNKAKTSAKRKKLNEFIQCIKEFHDLLYSATKSKVLIEVISRLADKFHLLRTVVLSSPGAMANSIAQHAEMLKAIENKDKKKCRWLMKNHLEEARKRAGELVQILF